MTDNSITSKDASLHAQENYTEYSIYVNQTRALPEVYDGLKTVQRRLIYQSNKFPSGVIKKSAEIVGNSLSLHPHGDESLYGSLVQLACPINNLPLYDIQGNFGGYTTGASAMRYTGASLSKIAKFIFCQFVDYAPMIEGELGKPEPAYLPTLIPYSLIEGTSGIGVGLASDQVPMDIMSLIDYYITYISTGKFDNNLPMVDLGSVIIDCDRNEYNSVMNSYKGSLVVKPSIKQESDNIFVIESLPTMKIDKLISKLKKYIDEELVDFRDETGSYERYVFEIVDKSVNPIDFKSDLEKCSSRRISFNRIVDHDGVSVFCPINYIIKHQINALNTAIDKKVDSEIKDLIFKSRLLLALEYLKKHGYFNKITKMSKEEMVSVMMKASDKIDIDEELCNEILKKPISYLTNSHDSEIESIHKQLDELKNHDRTTYLLSLYNQLKDMIMPLYSSRKHTVLKTDMIVNPRAKLSEEGNQINITGKGRGVRFNNFLVLFGRLGGLYKKLISVSREATVDLNYEEPIVDIGSDNCRYFEIIANDGTCVCYDMNNYRYDKKVVNLSENQYIEKVIGYTEDNVPDEVKNSIRRKISKTYKIR